MQVINTAYSERLTVRIPGHYSRSRLVLGEQWSRPVAADYLR